MPEGVAAGRVEGDDDSGQVDGTEHDGTDAVVDDPRPLPDAALERTRLLLLVQRLPDAFAHGAFDGGEFGGVALGWPQGFARSPSEGVAFLERDGGQVDVQPVTSLVLEDPAGQVVFVP
ncbi:hypothetical protein ACFVZD_47905, partial [Streptomyces sp. NPDC058287]|uniref:hypothetical protein n=1 Tax=Streptomyces sp. NPDC058287 TaxID=3346423 RepID=UPI0036EC46E9